MKSKIIEIVWRVLVICLMIYVMYSFFDGNDSNDTFPLFILIGFWIISSTLELTKAIREKKKWQIGLWGTLLTVFSIMCLYVLVDII
ncbi:hypothetical protein [Mangrovibacillus cuniculi]|uniref:Uncharacterized protein n=1 Tax=Mangrovibacillus cuniculi TaxID=2593652 RepID=A0A7S8HEL5_9BACI|nr:hypothetical protein [Mangrovibacillus cuniculi]QPC45530.1 hypothetical protein G8O30_00325 [Mangrovibacillus cuniculi]